MPSFFAGDHLDPSKTVKRRHRALPPLFVGYDGAGQAVHVDDLPNGGKTELKCPYCEGGLTAKKGDEITHHFAHSVSGDGCPGASRFEQVRMPLFDSFDWDLPPYAVREWKRRVASQSGDIMGRSASPSALAEAGLMVWNRYRGRSGDWELTKRGKVLEGHLSLRLFAELQEPMLWERLRTLIETAGSGGADEQTDLAIYRTQMQRAYQPFCLVAVGDRESGDRYAVGSDPNAPGVVVTLPHRAHLRTYFAHRFSKHFATAPISLAVKGRSPFVFAEGDLKDVVAELRRVPKRVLSSEESEMMGL